MSKNLIIIAVITLLIVGGYFLYKVINNSPALSISNQQTSQASQTEQVNNQNPSQGANVESQVAKTQEVVYTDSGYSPSMLTIKVGDTVTFKNQSSKGMWTASAMHPSHVVYSGTSLQDHCPDTANTSFDECKSNGPGTSWSFTFTKAGTWGYHNHVKASHYSKIVVE